MGADSLLAGGQLSLPSLFSPDMNPSQRLLREMIGALAAKKGASSKAVGKPHKALKTPKAGRGCDCVAPNRELETEQAYNAFVYRSRTERISLSAQFQQATARVGGEDGEAQVAARQLTFEFFAESRTEELVRFSQRTGAVAGQLEGAQRETYIEASRQVATRFSMSLEISGAALNGFANASEGLPEASAATIDDFNAFAGDALKQLDEIINRIFELLNDFFSSDADLDTRFAQFLKGIEELGLMDFGSAPSTGATNAVGVQASQFSVQLEFEFEYIEVTQAKVQESDPIILDLDGDGFELTSHANGARFDIEGAGRQVSTAFVTGGDAFLAIDRNGNGVIDSGKELFGDQNGASNGYEELRKLDSNHDGRINAADESFDALRLFRDNGNGRTEEGELVSLAEAGVSEINLAYEDVNRVAAGGNRMAQLGMFTYDDGRRGQAGDAILNFIV